MYKPTISTMYMTDERKCVLGTKLSWDMLNVNLKKFLEII